MPGRHRPTHPPHGIPRSQVRAYVGDVPVFGLQWRDGVLSRMAILTGVWAALTGLVIAAGEVVTNSAEITGFDHHVTRNVVSSRTGALTSAMQAVTWLGSWVALAVAAGVVAWLVVTKRLPVLAAIVAVFAWAGEALGVRVVKEAVSRNRPPEAIWLMHANGWSFPSGHTAAAALAFPALALCVTVLTRRRVVRVLGWLIAALAIAATAFSRVELGVHWTTDVIASLIFMSCWLAAIAVAFGNRLRATRNQRLSTPTSTGPSQH